MTANEAIAPATAQTHSFNLIRVLSQPWLDRSIAAIGCVPLVYLAYYRYEHWHHGFPLIASAVNVLVTLVCVGTSRQVALPALLALESRVARRSPRLSVFAGTVAAPARAGLALDGALRHFYRTLWVVRV